MNFMRRIWAIVLLGLAGFSLCEPALVAGAATQLPDCCRRMGQHHCASTREESAGVHFRNAVEHCPYFPGLPASPVQRHTSALHAGPSSFVVLIPQSDVLTNREFTHHSALHFSHPKRGPPVMA
jgi:hypothetical protein